MWNGKNKAVTFSYDDGITQDKRLIKLFDKYGLKWAEKTLPQEWIDDIILDLRGEYKLRLDDNISNDLSK